MNTTQKAVRVSYLDLVKAIAIVLVVFCHIPMLSPDSVAGNVFMVLAFAACPLFFLCSGAVMIASPAWSWKKWRIRMLTTYLTLTVWKALYLLFFRFLSGMTLTGVQLAEYLFFLGELPDGLTAHLWFMHAYLVFLLVLPVMHQLYHAGRDGKTALLITAAVLYFGSSWMNSPNLLTLLSGRIPGMEGLSLAPLHDVLPLGRYANMLVYCALGPFLYEADLNAMCKKARIRFPAVLAALGAVLSLGGLMLAKYVETGTLRWNGTFLTYGYDRRAVLVLSVSIFLLCRCLRMGRRFAAVSSRVGARTQAVYYLHLPLIHLALRFVPALITGYGSFPAMLLKDLVLVALCLLTGEVLRHIPLVKKLV